jgi:cell division protein ZipA
LRLAAGGQRFDGAQLREILELEELRHGRYDVYHRLHDDGQQHLQSVASMVEPGTFDRDKMPALTYPGVTLFAQLPGPARVRSRSTNWLPVAGACRKSWWHVAG